MFVISFDVEQGEFFGTFGRNGSGKSTLLKVLASVTGSIPGGSGSPADSLRSSSWDRLQPQLTALDNVILNGVMMGRGDGSAAAPRRSGRVRRTRGYLDLQIKNYSSGMKVRLGFAVMTHVDAHLLLVDEVLAVGDTDFHRSAPRFSWRCTKRGGRSFSSLTACRR